MDSNKKEKVMKELVSMRFSPFSIFLKMIDQIIILFAPKVNFHLLILCFDTQFFILNFAFFFLDFDAIYSNSHEAEWVATLASCYVHFRLILIVEILHLFAHAVKF
jgi:hypothetical protein